MSIDIDWSKLIQDKVLETNLRDFLDDQFRMLPLPPFIQSLRVSSLQLGTKPPELTIRHISDPFPEFYATEDDLVGLNHPHSVSDPILAGLDESLDGEDTIGAMESNTPCSPNSTGSPNLAGSSGSPGSDNSINFELGEKSRNFIDPDQTIPEIVVDPAPAIDRLNEALLDGPPADEASPFDFQAIVELAYQGDMQLGVNATLLVNYPSPNFVSLPLSFQVSSIDIHSLAVLAVISNQVSISVLCDVDSNDQMSSESVKVIKGMKIHSSIGDSSENGAVLRNVGRVEKFILEQLRKVIRDELVWPGWITLVV